jgi:hypothetical protein
VGKAWAEKGYKTYTVYNVISLNIFKKKPLASLFAKAIGGAPCGSDKPKASEALKGKATLHFKLTAFQKGFA